MHKAYEAAWEPHTGYAEGEKIVSIVRSALAELREENSNLINQINELKKRSL
jgi:hypothetical protein